MPVCVAQTVQKGTVRGATARHDGSLVSFACHRAPLAAQPLATRAWKGPPERHVSGCAGAWVQSGYLPRQASCRGRRLVAPGNLSLTRPRNALVGLPGKLLLTGPCCLAGTRGASRQVPWDALVGLPGKLLLPGPCLLSLNTLFLNGSKGTTEDLGGRPTSLAAGCCNYPCTSSGY